MVEYRSLLQLAIAKEYSVISIRDFWNLIHKQGKLDGRYLLLRHDIDTDLETAKEFFKIERQIGVKASYYFRLKTIDIGFMRELEDVGMEAGYHYEELASFAKEKRIKDKSTIIKCLPEIKARFSENLWRLREETGLPITVVASHGDFVNRYLGIPNWIILEDKAFRLEMNIDLEVYDEDLMKFVTSRHSDTQYPTFWLPDNPCHAIEQLEPVVYVLTHPRHWRANNKENFWDDFERLSEGFKYRYNINLPLKTRLLKRKSIS